MLKPYKDLSDACRAAWVDSACVHGDGDSREVDRNMRRAAMELFHLASRALAADFADSKR